MSAARASPPHSGCARPAECNGHARWLQFSPSLHTPAGAPQPPSLLHGVVSGLAPQTLDRGQYFFQNAASNNNWHTAGQILDDMFVFHHLGICV